MCLKSHNTTYFLPLLYVGVCLTVLLRTGFCADTAHNSKSGRKNGEDLSSPSQHGHNWNGWEDWLPEASERVHVHEKPQQYIPLSLSEQAKQRYRKNTSEQSQRQTKTPKIRAGETKKKDVSPPADLKSLRETAMNFGAMVLNHFASQWSNHGNQKVDTSSGSMPYFQPNRNSRNVYMENLGNTPDGPNVGKAEPEARRGVIDWLARLIGVQGKTLGKFLREYQVHVLYDLAFTFFKWIFFLYAGLLIP